MTPTDQVLLAIAALLITVNGLLPTMVTIWSHLAQSNKLDANKAVLQDVRQNTNGALADLKAELTAVKTELAAWKATQPGYLPPKVD